MKVLLSRLPMPPALYKCYVNNRRSGGRFPSAELVAYQRAMKDWAIENHVLVKMARREVGKCPGFYQDFLRIDRYIGFQRSRIWSQKNEPKKIDASNRVKALDDAIAEMIGVDDTYFVSGLCEKVTVEDSEPEQVTVVLSICEIHSMNQVHAIGPSGKPWAVTR